MHPCPGPGTWERRSGHPGDSLGLCSGHEALAGVVTAVRVIYGRLPRGPSAAARSIIDELPEPCWSTAQAHSKRQGMGLYYSLDAPAGVTRTSRIPAWVIRRGQSTGSSGTVSAISVPASGVGACRALARTPSYTVWP